MKSKEWILVIVAMVVVAVVVSIITASIIQNTGPLFSPSGNVIKVQTSTGKNAPQVYTADEIDAKLKTLKGACQYVGYKDATSTGGSYYGMTVMDICQKTFSFLPKAIVTARIEQLYNAPACSPSYSVFNSYSESLQSYNTDLAKVKLGDVISDDCMNAYFPDGKINGNFSEGRNLRYVGVLCCNN